MFVNIFWSLSNIINNNSATFNQLIFLKCTYLFISNPSNHREWFNWHLSKPTIPTIWNPLGPFKIDILDYAHSYFTPSGFPEALLILFNRCIEIPFNIIYLSFVISITIQQIEKTRIKQWKTCFQEKI